MLGEETPGDFGDTEEYPPPTLAADEVDRTTKKTQSQPTPPDPHKKRKPAPSLPIDQSDGAYVTTHQGYNIYPKVMPDEEHSTPARKTFSRRKEVLQFSFLKGLVSVSRDEPPERPVWHDMGEGVQGIHRRLDIFDLVAADEPLLRHIRHETTCNLDDEEIRALFFFVVYGPLDNLKKVSNGCSLKEQEYWVDWESISQASEHFSRALSGFSIRCARHKPIVIDTDTGSEDES